MYPPRCPFFDPTTYVLLGRFTLTPLYAFATAFSLSSIARAKSKDMQDVRSDEI